MTRRCLRLRPTWPLVLSAGCLLVGMMSVADGSAIQIVVPKGYADVEAPASGTNTEILRGQFIYAADQFLDLPDGGGYITSFRFRPDGATFGPEDLALDEITLSMSVTDQSPDTMSLTFVDNLTRPITIVRATAPWQGHTDNIGPDQGPKAFDMEWVLDTPYYYNPAEGNLLMEAAMRGPEWPIGADKLADGDRSQVAAIYNVTSLNAPRAQDYVGGYVTEFTFGPALAPDALRAGDADQDLDFDQFDLIKVQQAAKYMTGEPATWGEGDWNGAPGGSVGNPPPGNGVFDQLDIVAALSHGAYMKGPYACRFPSFIPFDAAQAEFPEGIAVDQVGNVHTSVATFGPVPALSDQIWKFSPSGEKSVLADFGSPRASALGLAVDTAGTVYMARGFDAKPYNGVYHVDKDGTIAQVPGTDQIVSPNALTFDRRGNLYITEMFSLGPSGEFAQGGIWRVAENGTAELWIRDDLLTGLPPSLFPYPVGANGVAFYEDDLFVINTDKALVVKVPILPDGSPGQAEIWKQVEDVPEALEPLKAFPLQIDGLAFDVLGNAYVTVPSRDAIVRINSDELSQETWAVYPEVPLDTPLNLAFGTGPNEQESVLISNGGVNGLFIPDLSWPGPGLVKIEVGVPGYPVPDGGSVLSGTITVPEPTSLVLALMAAAAAAVRLRVRRPSVTAPMASRN